MSQIKSKLTSGNSTAATKQTAQKVVYCRSCGHAVTSMESVCDYCLSQPLEFILMCLNDEEIKEDIEDRIYNTEALDIITKISETSENEDKVQISNEILEILNSEE